MRIPWDLQTRLQARAKARGVSLSEAIREACVSYVASEMEIRGPTAEINLVEMVAEKFDLGYTEARVALRLGRVKVNGEVERRLTVPPVAIDSLLLDD